MVHSGACRVRSLQPTESFCRRGYGHEIQNGCGPEHDHYRESTDALGFIWPKGFHRRQRNSCSVQAGTGSRTFSRNTITSSRPVLPTAGASDAASGGRGSSPRSRRHRLWREVPARRQHEPHGRGDGEADERGTRTKLATVHRRRRDTLDRTRGERN